MDLKQTQPKEPGRALPALRDLSAVAPFLPPAFELIPKLLRLLDDPEVSGEQLAELIRVDPGLTADILRVANSALFSRDARVETLIEAVSRVGLREIYRTVTRIIASPVLSNAQQVGFSRLELWQHSITCALAAQILATRLGLVESDVAFTVGLLHDIGKVVLGQAAGDSYIVLVEEAKLSSAPLYAREKAAYGTDHAAIGAKLLKQWNFPERIVSGIAFHHSTESSTKTNAPLAAIIYAANVLAYRVGSGYGVPPYAESPGVAVLRLINLDPATLFSYEEEVRQALEQERNRLQ